MSGPTIWDAARAIELRDEALLRVQARSAPWAAVAMDAARTVASRTPILSAEDIWRELDYMKVPRPPEPRAMGPVLMRAVKDGLIQPNGYARGTDPKHHRDILRTYRSLLWSEAEAREAWGR